MNWKQYQNELIALLAFIIMLGAYMYKHNKVTKQTQEASKVQQSIGELKEVIALKKVWSNKKITKKVDTLHTLIPASKVKWLKQKQKLSASYKGLTATELNKLTMKIFSLPVEMTLIDIKESGSSYTMELKCKW